MSVQPKESGKKKGEQSKFNMSEIDKIRTSNICLCYVCIYMDRKTKLNFHQHIS